MVIQELKLKNFRNYEEQNLEFNKEWNIIIGDNGVGKTNILESIYFLATSKSPRSYTIQNLIKKGRRNTTVEADISGTNIEGTLKQRIGEKKETLFDNVEKKNNEIIGIIPFVYFVPEDLALIKESASHRRRMLNFGLLQIYPVYKTILQRFRRVVLERNIVLKKIRDGFYQENYLDNWNKEFIELSIKILKKRNLFIKQINEYLEVVAPEIFGEGKTIVLKYKYSLHTKFKAEEVDEIKFKESLDNLKDKEIKYGITLVGPHRDDVEFIYKAQNLKHFGSQGEQRSAILCYKIALAKVLENSLEEKPILLFDDVLSELDNNRKEALLKVLEGDSQVFLTSTSLDGIKNLPEQATIFEIKEGRIYKNSGLKIKEYANNCDI